MGQYHRSSVVTALLTAAVVAVAATTLAAPSLAADAPAPKILVLPADVGADALPTRAAAQLATLDQFDVFAFFRFEDKLAESGIDFQNRVVDDAGRHYKAVHYDHGNGIAVADVDGDDRFDLYLTNQLGSNQLWRNLGGGKFEDITATAGVGVPDRISVTASFADLDNDGDQDLFVTTVKMGNLLFENDGKGRFREIAKQAGVDYVGHSSAVVVFDYDRDGLLDLFVTNVGTYTLARQGRGGYYVGVEGAFSGHLYPERTEPSLLYRNVSEPGSLRFVDVSKQTGLVDGSWSGDASAADLNRDGYPDLYVLNMQGDDHYYENEEGKRFVDRTSDWFPKSPWGTMGIKFFDWNRDGRMDLILTDMHSDMSEKIGVEREKLKSRMQWSEDTLQGSANNIFGNAFWENAGDRRMVEISDRIGAENYWPWGVSVDDLNADGWDDVLITASMNYPFRYGVNSVLLNNAGKKLLDSEFLLEVEPRKDKRVVQDWFELDCGGEDSAHEYCQDEAGPVVVRGTLGSRSAVLFDLDDDGDLDIVTNEFHAAPQVLISDLAAQTEIHFLKVRLIGRRSNRDGLGARVTVVAGGASQTKIHDGKSGYLSQSALPLYFGLGEHPGADRIEVVWPSGTRQVVRQGVPRNGLIEIVEELDSVVDPPPPATQPAG